MAAPARERTGAAIRNAFDDLADQQQPLPGTARSADDPAASLRRILGFVELSWGSAWYHNCRRWGTVDGYAPLAQCWDAWRLAMKHRILDRLNTMQATRNARAAQGDYASLVDDMLREAFDP